MQPSFVTSDQGRRLAFHKTEGEGPVVVFLGGFASDMSGTKAVFLEDWAKSTGRAFLRFDYSGHGESSWFCGSLWSFLFRCAFCTERLMKMLQCRFL